ncbi:DUF1837 domain-containing protein [bacterium]|nr:DUF1837 domain-containing protein [bacterium]
MSNFRSFRVEKETDKLIFLSLNVNDVDKLADECIDCFFNEEWMFSYFKALEENSIFTPQPENYVTLCRNLEYFFDDDLKNIRNDKKGKLGEYFLSILLLKYFHSSCILPKLIITTDRKMPVYGIDTVFYSPDRDMFMFGEAKFTSNISEGINLVNRSLKEYQNQFEDEYKLIVNNNLFAKSKNKFIQEFAGPSNKAITFKKFIMGANIKFLGVPIFICHGKEIDKNEIFNAFENKMKKIFVISGIGIKYVLISLPVYDSDRFINSLKDKLIKKRKEYERLSR